MTTLRIWRTLALLSAFSLIAAACGSSDDDTSSDSDGDTQVTAAPSGDSGDASYDIDNMPAELVSFFEAAAGNRATIVADLSAKIASGEYGVGEDNILRGAAGFEIDLNNCPEDWEDTTGITGSEVRIGHTTALTGTLARYGSAAFGWKNYFNWINENAPLSIDGTEAGQRDLALLIKDDAYVAAQTIEFIDELIESENVFALTTLGSPNTLAVYDKINNECIPHPYVISGHPAWGDPVNHPWTTPGLLLSYSTEAALWGSWIRTNLADQLPVKVAGLAMDNDFGLTYELGFAEWVKANPDVVSEFIAVRHDPAAPTITNLITTLAAGTPDVFIAMTTGDACVWAIQEVATSGLGETLSARLTPSVCKSIGDTMGPVGAAANGWWVVGGGAKDTTDPRHADEPFMKFVHATLEASGLDPSFSLLGLGYAYGYPYVESLRIAAALPGGLTRTNFILAVRSTSINHPLLLDGITFAANGAEDAYFVEGSDYSQFDAAEQSWNVVGDIVDANGKSPTCAWDKDNGGCN